jgi:hypothetical protein
MGLQCTCTNGTKSTGLDDLIMYECDRFDTYLEAYHARANDDDEVISCWRDWP